MHVHMFCGLTPSRLTVLGLLACWAALPSGGVALAADVFLNIELVSPKTPADELETNPIPHGGTFQYGDVWGEGIFAYVGSDRPEGGIYIFDISDPEHPDYLSTYFPQKIPNANPNPPGGEMEDVEVYNGIGYFGSDVDDSDLSNYERTGVDIVDVSNPMAMSRMARISTTTGFPQAHDKVHTLSVDNGFLYTADNQTPTIKIFNVSNPASPSYVTSIDLTTLTPLNNDLTSIYDTHEVMARNGKLYAATKNPGSSPARGWSHIFDVSNVGTTGPVLLAEIETGAKTHTASVSPDGNTMVIAQERSNGEVRIYDISMIDQPNDPDTPPPPDPDVQQSRQRSQRRHRRLQPSPPAHPQRPPLRVLVRGRPAGV